MNPIPNRRGQSSVEIVLLCPTLFIVFISLIEVGALCVRGELLVAASSKAARLSYVYNSTQETKDDLATLEAYSILPKTFVSGESATNRDEGTLTSYYVNAPLTGVNVFPGTDFLSMQNPTIPTLPEDLSDAAMTGDNPLPYCLVNEREIRPCPPKEGT